MISRVFSIHEEGAALRTYKGFDKNFDSVPPFVAVQWCDGYMELWALDDDHAAFQQLKEMLFEDDGTFGARVQVYKFCEGITIQ